MQFLLCLWALASAWLWMSTAYAGTYQAGFSRISVPGEPSFDVLVAYPTEVAETDITVGPFNVRASQGSPIKPGPRFPLVLFAIGNGRGAGSPWLHRGLILGLARQGFVVVAPFYPGTARPFINRPKQTRLALDTVLGDQRLASHVDPKQIAMIGYSFGGAVTLIIGGAKANLALLSTYCRKHGDDPRACEGIPIDGSLDNIPSRRSEDTVPLRALVLLEPFGALFGKDDLLAIDMPVLIYRALQSDLRADGNALSLAAKLPKRPRQVTVQGGHGVFITPCPPALATSAASLCGDPPSVDRAAVNREVEGEVAAFLRSIF